MCVCVLLQNYDITIFQSKREKKPYRDEWHIFTWAGGKRKNDVTNHDVAFVRGGKVAFCHFEKKSRIYPSIWVHIRTLCGNRFFFSYSMDMKFFRHIIKFVTKNLFRYQNLIFFLVEPTFLNVRPPPHEHPNPNSFVCIEILT